MAEQSIIMAGKVAIALAVIAGLLSLARAAYLYNQNGEVDVAKIALGLGIPALIFVVVKSVPRKQ
ncbi:MAG: hypothetical protein H0X49_00320 [Acidobacteria bacterium]|jgi:formate hydrogenlyase subunit 3/multisubunit Na+/H+ antiporter MnhD subunit|nr:hypothetical protein [Acidobacteriota bacterium]MBA4182447.1 hypothetical protein [Acidobacteriota bacterium]